MQSRPIETTANVREINNEVSTTHVRVVPIQHQEIQVTKNVQHDLDLWARIREYDQQMAEEGFTQVLSKKQQQVLKKQVLGKPSTTPVQRVQIHLQNESPLLEHPRYRIYC